MVVRASEPERRKRYQSADLARRPNEGVVPFAPQHHGNDRAFTRGPDPLIFVNAERIVQVWWIRQRQIAELSVSFRKMERACAYLARPACNQALGFAALEAAVLAHAKCLEQLRGSRSEAHKLVNRLDANLGFKRNQAI